MANPEDQPGRGYLVGATTAGAPPSLGEAHTEPWRSQRSHATPTHPWFTFALIPKIRVRLQGLEKYLIFTTNNSENQLLPDNHS